MRYRTAMTAALLTVALAGPASAAPSHAANAVKAGELVIDPATLINLGFEWIISGDDNRNAKVEVSYRKKGEKAWRKAMPLMRLQGERVYQSGGVFNVKMPNMFAGSILDLEENTVYEARFVLSDPDGGHAERIVTAKTRAEPRPAAGGHVYHVYPRDWKGPKEPGFFNDLMCAYNYYCGGGDTQTGARPRVKAGDTILVHAGVYRYHPEYYTGDKSINSTTPVEGTYYLFANGTPDKPIVIKGAGDGEVVFDGGGNFNLFNLKAANYNYFEGLTFRNTEIAIWAGTQFQSGSVGLTVKRSRFENVNLGIFTNWAGSSDITILDNVFIGRDDPNLLQGWAGDFWKQFAGVQGHVDAIFSGRAAGEIPDDGHLLAVIGAGNGSVLGLHVIEGDHHRIGARDRRRDRGLHEYVVERAVTRDLGDEAVADQAAGPGFGRVASALLLDQRDGVVELLLLLGDEGGKTGLVERFQLGLEVGLAGNGLDQVFALAVAGERRHQLDVLRRLRAVLREQVDHHVLEMPARDGAELAEGGEEMVVSRRLRRARAEIAHRQRIDDAVVGLLLGRRVGSADGFGDRRRAFALVAGRIDDCVVAHLHAEAIGDGPGDIALGKDAARQMNVQVAALGHAVEEGAQRRRVGARVGERCGGDGGVPVAGEPGGGDKDGEAAERCQHACAPPSPARRLSLRFVGHGPALSAVQPNVRPLPAQLSVQPCSIGWVGRCWAGNISSRASNGRAAHAASDTVYERLTGEKNRFAPRTINSGSGRS